MKGWRLEEPAVNSHVREGVDKINTASLRPEGPLPAYREVAVPHLRCSCKLVEFAIDALTDVATE